MPFQNETGSCIPKTKSNSHIKVVVLSLMLISGLACLGCGGPHDADFQKANKLFQEGKFEEVKTVLKSVLEKDPQAVKLTDFEGNPLQEDKALPIQDCISQVDNEIRKEELYKIKIQNNTY